MSASEHTVLREFLDKNLARGFIQPSTTLSSAPAFFVRKKTEAAGERRGRRPRGGEARRAGEGGGEDSAQAAAGPHTPGPTPAANRVPSSPSNSQAPEGEGRGCAADTASASRPGKMAAAACEGERAGAAAAADWVLPSEVEVLESIYLDELQVSEGNGRTTPWEICITLYPATAEDQDSQYVCFTLVLAVPTQYPNEVPKIDIQNPRGLSDEQIQKISQTLQHLAEEHLGTPILYELIEKGKEILTDNNIPHGQCVICLYGFQENEAFIKTPCYHYFHSHCLGSYAAHMEEEIRAQRREREQTLTSLPKEVIEVQCPVCRKPLVYDLATLQAAAAPQQPMEVYCPDAKTLQHREQLRLIYQKQQEKGGIIDPEAERNRYFISLQKPLAPFEHEHAVISEDVTSAEKQLGPLAASEHTLGTAKVAPARNESEKVRPFPPLHHHGQREKTRGGRSSSRGPGQQLHCNPLEAPAETCYRFTSEEESKAFGWRSHCKKEGGNCGRYNQSFLKPCTREQVSACTDKKELCARGTSPAKEGTSFREEKIDVQRWTPKQEPEAQGKEDGLEASHHEVRRSARWQGQHAVQDCRRWGKPKGREHWSYSRMPRGQGWMKPKSGGDPQVQQTEGGS
uniref:E3 ubiquitin-protein ligase RNF25 n=1 Tax=Euleptes europaea TaxID=460621 RepID=UPI0025402152|nr:E3 ubiquitin-protein ligase RNF25 [Euleptes europaea]